MLLVSVTSFVSLFRVTKAPKGVLWAPMMLTLLMGHLLAGFVRRTIETSKATVNQSAAAQQT
jgi:hypothetical protein